MSEATGKISGHISDHKLQPASVSMSYACTICGDWEDLEEVESQSKYFDPVYMQYFTNIPEICKQCRADLAEIIKERRAKRNNP